MPRRYRLGLAGSHGTDLVSSCNGAQSDRGGCLTAGVGEHRGRIKADARWAVKLDQRSGHGSSLIVIDLHNQRILERGAGGAHLVATTGFDQRGSLRGGLEPCVLPCGMLAAGERSEAREARPLRRHGTSCMQSIRVIIASLLARLGPSATSGKLSARGRLRRSCSGSALRVPGRSACGFLSHA